MKKVVILKVYLPDDRAKQKAIKAVSSLAGVVSTDMGKDQKLTVTGDMDTVDLVRKLRKLCSTEILSVEEPKNNKNEKEPLKEEPNKEKETEKEEPKKENESEKEEPKEDKKEKEPLKEEPKKEKETQKEEPKKDEMAELVKAYEAYNPYMAQPYFLTSAEENPNACAIC